MSIRDVLSGNTESARIVESLTPKQRDLVRMLKRAGADGVPLTSVDGRLTVGVTGKLVTGTLRKHNPPRLKLSALGRAVAARL